MRSRERDMGIFSRAAKVRRGGSKGAGGGGLGLSSRNFLATPRNPRRASEGMDTREG